jgi:hypothetical protein
MSSTWSTQESPETILLIVLGLVLDIDKQLQILSEAEKHFPVFVY